MGMEGQLLGLLKPMTYMNRSGLAVREAAESLGLRSEDIVVVHDDVDLPLTRMRIKRRGGNAGHLGVLSIIEQLGTEEFVRVRIGIGRPLDGDVRSYVLGDFTPQEREHIARLILHCEEAVRTMLRSGVQEAMNRFNGLQQTLLTEG